MRLIVLLAIFLFSNAYAENRWDYYAPQTVQTKFTTGIQACNFYIQKLNEGYAPSAPYSFISYTEPDLSTNTNGTAGVCRKVYTPNGSQTNSQVNYSYSPDCTSGHYFDTTSHTCQIVPTCGQNQYLNNNNQCVDNPTCTPPEVLDPDLHICKLPSCASKSGHVSQRIFTTTSWVNICLDNCQITIAEGTCGHDVNGAPGCYGYGVYDGQSCTNANPADQPTSSEFDCLKKGLSYGMVNGVAVCVPNGSAGSSPVTTTTNQSSSNTTTTTDAQGNVTTQQTDSQTQVVDNGSTVTETTTTTNPDGSTTETTETKDKQSFCQENPNASVCKEQKDPCLEYPDRAGCAELGTPTEGEDIATTNIGLDFNLVSLPSASGCPTPETINIHGLTIPLKYDAICQYASAFHPFVIIFAWIAAAYIVAGAINKE